MQRGRGPSGRRGRGGDDRRGAGARPAALDARARLRRGYKNVKKQPTGLSKEVREGQLPGGGRGRGLIPHRRECLPALPPTGFCGSLQAGRR